MSPLVAGLALALASALSLNAGFALQHHAASRLTLVSLRHPLASGRSLLGARRWVAGFVLGLAGWALYLAALGLAPLSLVQAVAASGIGLLVLGVAVARRRLPARREALAALIATGGLVALGLSVIGARAPRAHAIPAARMLACAGLVAGLACLLARRRSAGAGGTSAGLLYGLGDLATKALLVSLPVHAGVASVLLDPYLALALAAHAAGFVTLQRAFSRGGVVDAIAPLTAAMNLLPIVAGVVVLDDALPGSSLLLTLRLGAFAAAAIGAWLLARIRGRPAEPRTSQDMPPTPFEPGFAAWT